MVLQSRGQNSPATVSQRATLHIPVMLGEVAVGLMLRPGGKYVDGTVGGGGHAASILQVVAPEGKLLGLDADLKALEVAREILHPFGEAALLIQANFAHLESACTTYNFRPVEGILLDLGLSSLQLGGGRGFSFQEEASLDMRYDPAQELTAGYIVNHYPEAELAQILDKFGEERHSRRITQRILENRPIRTARELATVVEMAFNGLRGHLHPATRTFMALRIAVNQELENLAAALRQSIKLLSPGGRLVVIAYHSLEDRVVKEFMSRESRACLCPPRNPVCLCHHVPTLRIIARKVVVPSPEEVKANPRSRSARLRVAERL